MLAFALALAGGAVVVLRNQDAKKPAEGVPASLEPRFKIRAIQNGLAPVAQHTTYCIDNSNGAGSYSYSGGTVGRMSLGRCP